ncbi:UTP--glucose-1-phosphate uridylyltransferase GalU [Polynucleobacter sp. JS-JIR-II-50]|uniref:UTP--glucose-1-phosphate uridylyltransferase GalU n=1 Tax=Polynucleobacter sp. JS-JIR-II-50 TaxID=2576919 RepID=UPI001BFD10BA|nr:UTP--glucose-1-phosphate uridylyltransferase GalU [Polynucleobacter sp. JS-JIR-II-50]QWE04180.1 UTP--glucose-1-phosphate uridylyltransferase GalU [Polynucleobacter sp. JS-JIR-II-50]
MSIHFGSKKVTKAVFPVAGFGTRFLPATKASPKEMLNVVDKPLIQYAVDEAVAAGITELIFVTGRSKRAIEDHFDKAYELEAALEAKNKQDLLQLVRSVKPDNVDCIYIRQAEPLGLGHAVLCAARVVGDEPFAVILADDLLDGQPPVLSQMLKVYEEQAGSVLAVEKIDPAKSSSYGIVSGDEVSRGIYRLNGIVEKPKPIDAPSDLAVVGRYVLSAKIFDHIRNVKPGAGGEIQLTDAIAALLKEEPVFAYEYDGVRYDCGSKLGYLKASVDFALRHKEVGEEFAEYLRGWSLK